MDNRNNFKSTNSNHVLGSILLARIRNRAYRRSQTSPEGDGCDEEQSTYMHTIHVFNTRDSKTARNWVVALWTVFFSSIAFVLWIIYCANLSQQIHSNAPRSEILAR
jgi:hypothetical protein